MRGLGERRGVWRELGHFWWIHWCWRHSRAQDEALWTTKVSWKKCKKNCPAFTDFCSSSSPESSSAETEGSSKSLAVGEALSMLLGRISWVFGTLCWGMEVRLLLAKSWIDTSFKLGSACEQPLFRDITNINLDWRKTFLPLDVLQFLLEVFRHSFAFDLFRCFCSWIFSSCEPFLMTHF